ncbi:cyanate permease [Maribacter vaceletii]|uniref:Cyanate permease n=1 Tax=Maribacter vaceletii TaxID=1206816 RepID=A0A495EED4_9FLAO|nr:MFS transporter [Maribacter vaceletii]RKR15245.1 cyanate permease [Maribacter vaceletii]
MANKNSFLKVLGVAILGTILLIVSNGLTISGITIFDEAILNDLDWTKSELKFRDFINLVSAALLAPFVGAVIDKYGAKRLMIIGLLVISAMLYLYSKIEFTWHVYLIHFVFAIALSGAGALAVLIMVSKRVTEKRGIAIGIALAGTSAGGIIIPQIGIPLLKNFGWRTAFQYEALLPILVAILLLIFIKPVTFKEKTTTDTSEKDKETGLIEVQFKKALKTPVFWAICIAGACCFYSIMGLITNLFLYLREQDFSVVSAGNTLSIFFMIILGSKLVSGAIAEYINEHKLFKIQVSLMALGALCIALDSPVLVWPALILYALGWGGLYTIINYIIITTFGVKSAGKIGGIIAAFKGLGAGLGAWMTGLISDQTGSYSMSFWVVVIILCIAISVSFFIKPIVSVQETGKIAS